MANPQRLTAATALAAVLYACAPHPGPTREVIIIARGMTFVVVGDERTNPPITLRAGERVKLILKNEAPGLLHDFVIPEWGVEIGQIRAGETSEVTFVVPDAPERVQYRCRPHARMSGFVLVSR